MKREKINIARQKERMKRETRIEKDKRETRWNRPTNNRELSSHSNQRPRFLNCFPCSLSYRWAIIVASLPRTEGRLFSSGGATRQFKGQQRSRSRRSRFKEDYNLWKLQKEADGEEWDQEEDGRQEEEKEEDKMTIQPWSILFRRIQMHDTHLNEFCELTIYNADCCS